MARIPVKIRPFYLTDVDDVVRIRNQHALRPTTVEEFRRGLDKHQPFLSVAFTRSGTLAGYAAYHLAKSAIELVNLVVHRAYQRSSIGTQLLTFLKAGLARDARWRLVANVDERNLAAHCFLRANELRAVEVLRDYYADRRAAYQFEYRVPGLVVAGGDDAARGAARYGQPDASASG